MNRLSRRPERWQDLHAGVGPEWWLAKQVNELVRELKKEGAITPTRCPATIRSRGKPGSETRETEGVTTR
jgi:hypothetical protein